MVPGGYRDVYMMHVRRRFSIFAYSKTYIHRIHTERKRALVLFRLALFVRSIGGVVVQPVIHTILEYVIKKCIFKFFCIKRARFRFGV